MRTAFAGALALVRDGAAELICAASLAQVADDVVVQELLLAEARGAGVPLASADPGDDDAFLPVPTDPARALIREVLALAPQFNNEMRSLRARVRRAQTLAELEGAHAALVRIEAMEERGATPQDILSMLGAHPGRRRTHRVIGAFRAARPGHGA